MALCAAEGEGKLALAAARARRQGGLSLGEISSATDEELVLQIGQASEVHFRELYERTFHWVYGFAYSRVRNHADAEELTQEIFASVFSSIAGYRGRSSLLTWIYGVAKNTVNDHLRQAKAHDERLRRAGPGVARGASQLESASPEEQLGLRRKLEAVRESLDALTPWQVEVFFLRHFENLSIVEIAERTSRSRNAVRSSLYRVKRVLLDAGGFESQTKGRKGSSALASEKRAEARSRVERVR